MTTNKLLEIAMQHAADMAARPKPLAPEQLFRQLIDAPMYREISLHTQATSQVAQLCKLDHTYDRYCPTCSKETAWRSHVTANREKVSGWAGVRNLQNYCLRCRSWENLWFYFYEFDELLSPDSVSRIVKIGQLPSVASFHGNDLARYVQVTSDQQRADFIQAVEAAAHGFAAGACTYLRRVLEGILNEARDVHMKENSLTDWPEYEKAKTNKKMELLKDRLPPFLTANKRLYNLLSQGIHSLPDEDCQELYPVLRQAIELLFDEKLELAERENHRKKIAQFIAQNDNPKN